MSEVKSISIKGVMGTVTVNYLYNNTDRICSVIFDFYSEMFKTYDCYTLEVLPL